MMKKLLFLLVFALWTSQVGAATKYASNATAGAADGSSCSNAFLISTWKALPPAPGDTLILCSDTSASPRAYTGANSMLNLSGTGISGSSGSPITIRAEVDGGALIDGQNARQPVLLSGNDWIILEGFGVRNADGHGPAVQIGISADNNIIRRLVVWNSDDADAIIGNNANTGNVFEDIACFGVGRNCTSFSQGANDAIMRRAFGIYNFSNDAGPKDVLNCFYQSYRNICENNIAMWNQEPGTNTSQTGGYLTMNRHDAPASFQTDGKWLGSMTISPASHVRTASNIGHIWLERSNDNVEFRDIILYNEPGSHTAQPAILGQILDGGSGGVSVCSSTEDGVCDRDLTDITQIGFTAANSINAATITQSNVRSYASISAMNTANAGPFQTSTGTGGRMCFRYQDGTLTSNPLWPFPMNQRIVDAMTLAGKTPINITTTLEGIYGTIPLACQRLKPLSADTTSATVVRLVVTNDQSPAKNPDVTKFTLTQSGVSLPLTTAVIAGTNIIDITTSGAITVGTTLVLSGSPGAFQDNYGVGSMTFSGFGVTNNVSAGTTDVFVDNTNSCTGDDGSSAEPWCSIAAAFLHPGLGSGSVIKIRTGTGTYTESTATLNVSGSAGNPIVIQLDTAASFVIRSATASGDGSTTAAAIRIRSSYVTITGLTCDGAGVYTARYCILVDNNGADINGITITGNTFQNWGGTGASTLLGPTALRLNGDYSGGFKINSPQLTNNTFINNAHEDIRTTYSFDAVIQGNVSTGLKCGKYQDFAGSQPRMGTQSIKIAGGVSPAASTGGLVASNSISAPNLDCSAVPDVTGSPGVRAEEKHNGIYCDTGVSGVTYEKNIVSGTWGGIFVESRCHQSKVLNNQVKDLAGTDTGDSFGIKVDADDITVANNTVAGCTVECLQFRDGARGIVKNNVFVSGGARVVRYHTDAVAAGGHVINNNRYHNTASANAIGSWGDFTNDTFTQWKNDCLAGGVSSCDANSSIGDPAFTNYAGDDLTLTASSTGLINAGTSVAGVGCNNPACDIGAYEKMEYASGNVGAAGATKVTVNIECNRYSCLTASNPLTGWTVKKAGANNPVSAAVITGNTVTLTVSAFLSTDSCSYSYDSATGNITDNAPFANKQKLLSVVDQPCSNTVTAGSGTLALNSLTSGEDATDRSTAYTTASVTITADRLAILATHIRQAALATPTDPTIGGTLAATWTQVGAGEVIYETEASDRNKLNIFCTKVGANQTGTITITPGGGNTLAHAAWSLVEFTGVVAGGVCTDDIAQAAYARLEPAAAATTFSVPLGAFALAENRPYMACSSRILAADDQVPDTGWTQIHEVDVTGEVNTLFTEWHATAQDQTPALTWTTSDNDIGCGALEIKASSGAAPSTRPVGASMLTVGAGR